MPAVAVEPRSTSNMLPVERWQPLVFDTASNRLSAVNKAPMALRAVDKGRPSHQIRELLEGVASAEVQNEILQDQNNTLRVRCLQHLRHSILSGLTRLALNAWVSAIEGSRRLRVKKAAVNAIWAKMSPILMRTMGFGPKAILLNCLRGWRGSLQILRDNNRMLDELEAHTRGRTQLITQYRSLDSEYQDELQRATECERRLEESQALIHRLRQEIAWATGAVKDKARETEELRSDSASLDEQLRESHDKTAELRCQVRTLADKMRRLQQDLLSEEREKAELQESLLRSERLQEKLRSDIARRETNTSRHTESLREKDALIASLEAQIHTLRSCIASSVESLAQHTVDTRGAAVDTKFSATGAFSIVNTSARGFHQNLDGGGAGGGGLFSDSTCASMVSSSALQSRHGDELGEALESQTRRLHDDSARRYARRPLA
eukprot:TRINITY_DN75979_c0_g1_i1.p1 TRINITY_DN75979_c0_g1~~TRINITY_DN75979_c0_g1_i1.p1  ORF type:complete len:467 (-),score=91.58 TRINITY_DN75979_c0_g1_i1:24-1331(-)